VSNWETVWFIQLIRIITGLSRLSLWDLLENGDGGLAGPDNAGVEPVVAFFFKI